MNNILIGCGPGPTMGERALNRYQDSRNPSHHPSDTSFKTALEGLSFFDELFCTGMIFLNSGLV